MSVIKKGFQLNIITWENDGDCYNTTTLDGLDKENAQFLLAFCQMFKSGHNIAGCYGNMELYSHDIDDKLSLVNRTAILAAKYNQTEVLSYLNGITDTTEAFEYITEIFVYELIGYAYESSCVRVFESATCFYIPEDIPEVDLNVDIFKEEN